MPSDAPIGRKLPLLKLATGVAFFGVLALLLMRGVNVRELADQAMEVIRGAGPVAFFVALALLPAAGVPVSAFTLTAGPAFSERFGVIPVLLLSLAAITINLLLTYALARRALRPLLERLIARLGYKIPQVESGDTTGLVVILRVTPGIPFFIQNYLCGLAEVPFGKFLGVSCVVVWTYTTAFVLFGDALLHGKGKLALLAVSLLVAGAAITHLLRKRYARKKAMS